MIPKKKILIHYPKKMVGTRSGKVRPNNEVGRILLEARRRRRISLVTASRDIKVSANHLSALEEGDFSVFSAEVYARGAYIRYASYLKVDTRQAERAILRALSGAREMVPLYLHTPRSLIDRLLTPAIIFSVLIGLMAFGIGGYIAWQVESFLQLPDIEMIDSQSVTLSDDMVTIKGLAEQDARVNINGENVLLREDNSFELSIYLRPGVNIIRVEAQNAAGRKRVIEKHVLLPDVTEGRLASQNDLTLH